MDAIGAVGLVAFALVGLIAYFLPSIIAMKRGTDHAAGIMLLNLFLGWTLIGWVAALVWAVSDSTE